MDRLPPRRGSFTEERNDIMRQARESKELDIESTDVDSVGRYPATPPRTSVSARRGSFTEERNDIMRQVRLAATLDKNNNTSR